MVKLHIPFGKDGAMDLSIPIHNFLGELLPKDVPEQDELGMINASLDKPFGEESIEEFLRGGQDVVFIVNDGTRPTPTAKVLQALSHRVDLTKFRYLIATGTHRGPNEEELRFIFGEQLEKVRGRIHSHDSKKDHCIHLGRSKNGTDMDINEMAVNADRLVIITSVEPHYFAGYTGGRKSFLPGVAAHKTVTQNHRLAMRKEAQVLALEGNPVHEDMIDALRSVQGKRIFSVQVVMDRHQHVYRSASGDLFQAFEKAVHWANEVFVVDLQHKADMVISVAPYPMDVDLYQSQKAIDNAKFAVKQGGMVLLVSKCRQGVGEEVFCQQLSASNDPHIILDNLHREYRLGFQKAAKVAEIMTYAKVCAVTELDEALLKKANIQPFRSVQDAVDALLARQPDAKILVMMDGSVTVPRVV
jgi:lactate racemase